MKQRVRRLLKASLTSLCLVGFAPAPLAAQNLPGTILISGQSAPSGVRITLEEAKQQALANNKLLNLAALNVEAKAYAIRAAKADYFPKVAGSALYLHFQDDLGTVITGGGKTVSGPRGRPLLTLPTFATNAAVLNQDSSLASVTAVQPITDLLKVRQGVKIAHADQGIAQAQMEKGIRDLASGVEQLYWGLLAARRIQAGAVLDLKGAEMLAKTKSLEARIALVEARQGLQLVDQQIAGLQEQMNGLLDLPSDTILELVEPPLPELTYRSAEEVVPLALAASPEVREAQQTIAKAEAAQAAGKLDYVPSIAVLGGYANQTGADYMQQNIGFVGAVASYTFVDWGKRKSVVRERRTFVAMAHLKLRQTEDDVRQKAAKAFRELLESQGNLKSAQEMVDLRRQAEKQASTPEALRDPTVLLSAAKARGLAEVDLVKTDLAYRQAYVQLKALISDPSDQVVVPHPSASGGRP